MTFPHLVLHEDLQPHRVDRLCLFATEQPTAAVDIGDWLASKLEALGEHGSQGPERLVARARAAARDDGLAAGLELAETLAEVELASVSR
jgi:hypothetical protein